MFRLPRDGVAVLKTLVAKVVRLVDGLAVELGQQDVRDGAQDALLRTLQQVREADINLCLAQADGRVERDKGTKAYLHLRHGRARSQVAILLGKDARDVIGREPWTLCTSRAPGGALVG